MAWLYIFVSAWPSLSAQTAPARNSTEVLNQLSDSVQALTARVAPSVVQILVNRAVMRDGNSSNRTGAVTDRQQTVGSGVIIDPDGFIVTNAHVIADAQRIRVNLTTRQEQSITNVLAHANAPLRDATLIGVFKEADLALLKIAATDLPALHFAEYKKLRQGQLVFAFGSPEDLNNSVSMGVVSSVARQPDPDSPFIYIQTDAPINPGDSGGPLVNAAGEIVGIDTFILTQSGGSEGIGFAIPSALVQFVCMQLRKYGHFHRLIMGAGVQTVTPILAKALKLPRDAGVIVSDILPGSPAQSGGVKLNDIVLAVDSRQIDNVPMFMMALLAHNSGQFVQLQVLRGNAIVPLEVQAVEEGHPSDRLADVVDPDRDDIPKLGILGVGIDKQTEAMFPNLRGPYGVVVAARSVAFTANLTGLQIGDVIHEVNGTVVTSADALRAEVGRMKRGDPVALFVEREGRLLYVAFEME